MFPPNAGWSANTVKTLLGRLIGKNAIAYEEDGRRYLYRPAGRSATIT